MLTTYTSQRRGASVPYDLFDEVLLSPWALAEETRRAPMRALVYELARDANFSRTTCRPMALVGVFGIVA